MRKILSFQGANEVSEPGIHNPCAGSMDSGIHRFAMSRNYRKKK